MNPRGQMTIIGAKIDVNTARSLDLIAVNSKLTRSALLRKIVCDYIESVRRIEVNAIRKHGVDSPPDGVPSASSTGGDEHEVQMRKGDVVHSRD